MGKIFLDRLHEMRESGLISEEVFEQLRTAYEEDNKKSYNQRPIDYDLYIQNAVKARTASCVPIITSEEQQERMKEQRITIILSIGIIFILLAGLILATTSWEVMGSGLKTITLCMVSVLFFALNVFTEKKLKIKKTSFAFWTLGVLFLPVILLSISWFGLFGEYLSMTGEGGSLYGVISTIVCLPFCLYSVEKYKKQFFVVLSLLCTLFTFIFYIAWIEVGTEHLVSVNLFYIIGITIIYELFRRYDDQCKFILHPFKRYTLVLFMIQWLCYILFMISEPDSKIATFSTIISILLWIGLSLYWTAQISFVGLGIASSILIFLIPFYIVLFTDTNFSEFTYYMFIYAGLIIFYLIFYFWNKKPRLQNYRIGIDVSVFLLSVFVLINKSVESPLQISILYYLTFLIIALTTYRAKNRYYQISLGGLGGLFLYLGSNVLIRSIEIESFEIWGSEFHGIIILQILFVALLVFLGEVLYKRYTREVAKGFLVIVNVIALIHLVRCISVSAAVCIVGLLIYIGICIRCIVAYQEEKVKTAYFYIAHVLGNIVVYKIMAWSSIESGRILIPENSIAFYSLLLFVAWLLIKNDNQKKLGYYMNQSFLIGILTAESYLLSFEPFSYTNFFFLVFCNICYAYYIKKSRDSDQTVKGIQKYKMLLVIFTGFILYVALIWNLPIFNFIRMEISFVSSVIVAHLVCKYYEKQDNQLVKLLFYIWYSLSGMVLFFHINSDSRLAIIYGVIFIASIIFGFLTQHKIYFLGGSIFLVVGVIVKTLWFWSKIPWWVYLLVAGTGLITFAVRKEMRK